MHLWELPNVSPLGQEYIHNYKDDNKDMIVIFPIFQRLHWNQTDDASIEHHIARAACWARRSWLLFSDAIERNIPIKFYVERKAEDKIMPILQENFMDEHVLFFDGDHIEIDDNRTHLGKKMVMFNDPQFADYEWVFQTDVDCMMADPQWEEGTEPRTFPFFEHFLDHRKDIGSVCIFESIYAEVGHPDLVIRNITDYHWLNGIDRGNLSHDDLCKEWIRLASTLVDFEIAERYNNYDIPITEVHGAMYAFPAKEFHTNRKEDCQWIEDAGRLFQDDEAVFSLWAEKGNKMFSIIHELDLPFACQLEVFKERREMDKHYISHIGNMSHLYYWRHDIGATRHG